MQLFINNWSAVLTAPATTSAVSLSVDPTMAAQLVGLGAGHYYLATLVAVDAGGIETAHEVVKVTAVAGGMLIVERAQEGTAAADWPAASGVSARVTKGTFERLRDASAGAPLSSVSPKELGSASAGTGTSASRDDHVHPKPTPADIGAATAAQGAKADSAVQPGTLSTVATSGAYADLSGKPAIPSNAAAVGAVPTTDKGAANGVATLDAGGKLPLAQVPATAITDTSVVTSQAAMLALTAQTGDVAIRTDISTSFILAAEPASTLGNWKEILAPSSGGGAAVGSSVPQALGVATPGVSASASRQDHVHAMPSAADVGAATAAHGHGDVVAGGASGFMTGAQAAKLAGITAGATANADTDSLSEGATNKWFTVARVIASALTGLSVVTGGAVVSTDSVLVGIGKLQKQLTDLIATVGGKQDALVSGTNIKTVNGSSLLGSGDLSVSGGGGSASASSVTYTADPLGAVATTVGSKLNESISVADFGGVGDGSASDQAKVEAAIAAEFSSVTVNDGKKFLVTALTNAMGVDLSGPGDIVKSITGGLQKLNSPADNSKLVFGQEYMAAFHNLLIAQRTKPTRKPIIVFSGDSTTAGDGVSADFKIDQLIKTIADDLCVQSVYGLSVINRGQSGANTEQWRTSYLSGDLSANPDLLVLRWGINDPGWLKAGTSAPANAGQSYAGRRDAADFITSLRTGLASIRSSRAISSLSIMLMSPNSTSDTPNARDELWYESIIPGIKQAARDYGCVFVDTYAFLRDSRTAAGVWMDNPFSDGRAIHPANVMNTWIAGLMAPVIFPQSIVSKLGMAGLRSIGGVESPGSVAALPNAYPFGITLGRAATVIEGGTEWPFSGATVTIRTKDEIAYQMLVPFRNADRGGYQYRMGRSAVLEGESISWGSWVGGGVTSSSNVSPVSGFSIPGSGQARAVKDGNQIICEGYIIKASVGTVAANTTIATLPVGFRPISEAVYWNATIWDGSSWGAVTMRVQPDGVIATAQATPIPMSRIWLNAGYSDLT